LNSPLHSFEKGQFPSIVYHVCDTDEAWNSVWDSFSERVRNRNKFQKHIVGLIAVTSFNGNSADDCPSGRRFAFTWDNLPGEILKSRAGDLYAAMKANLIGEPKIFVFDGKNDYELKQ